MNSPRSAGPPAGTVTDPGPYRGTGVPHRPPAVLPAAPPWRTYRGGPDLAPPPDDEAEADRRLGAATPTPVATGPVAGETAAVNAALLLRRPLLITGPSGVGRSAVAFRVARELGLGRVLHWTVTGASVLRGALYTGGPAGVRLGPVGTALLPYGRPRVLLVEGLDRGDFDLPVELRAALRRGGFDIPELADDASATVTADDPGVVAPAPHGVVACHEPPITVITAGRSQIFPPEFLADCLHWEHPVPTVADLTALVRTRAGITDSADPRLLALVAELAEAWSADPQALGRLTSGQVLDAVALAAAAPWPREEAPDAVAARLLGLLRAHAPGAP
ncbi:MoxR family ATPase [Streptomyces sp. NBC_01381]|uniref:MoxR family ATPase n=1 Tax=Streptomyces sp. NBC_01381 TaxID=2903845 RepID=UPI002254F1EA|nr:MoxR family ATPase [Streptomyces sp. NBC_01381]MCX4673151.1 MoxR family ATPase [Streptomyces sp. NBC_01381]